MIKKVLESIYFFIFVIIGFFRAPKERGLS